MLRVPFRCVTLPPRRLCSTLPPVLTQIEILAAMKDCVRPDSGKSETFAFFSSAYGGIVTDPSLMTVPVDEHAFHRGHCVFDTANVNLNGTVYGLDIHLERLLKSADAACISHSYQHEQLRELVLSSVAAAGRRDLALFVRYWLTAGLGNFDISPKGTSGAEFYCVVHRDHHRPFVCGDPGLHASTVQAPLKPPLLARIKSNNYMINAIVCLQADEQGTGMGVQFRSAGSDPMDDVLQESAVSSLVLVSREGRLLAPKADTVLASTTVGRLFEQVAPALQAEGLLKGFEQRDITRAEVLDASELIEVGGHWSRPVSLFDGHDFDVGPVFFAAQDRLLADFNNPDMLHTPPYSRYQ